MWIDSNWDIGPSWPWSVLKGWVSSNQNSHHSHPTTICGVDHPNGGFQTHPAVVDQGVRLLTAGFDERDERWMSETIFRVAPTKNIGSGKLTELWEITICLWENQL